jgi:hypothetical protein
VVAPRTIIGLIIGSVIIALGASSLIIHMGPNSINENYYVEVGQATSYTIPAPANTPQSMKIIGDAFDLKLESPGDGLQIPKNSYYKF